MARRIEVDIVGDSRSLERAFARSERSAQKFQGTMAATSSKVSRSMGVFGFGVSGPAAAAGGAFLLGRQFVKAARDAEVILGQTSIAVKDAGLSWVQYSKQVEAASQRISDSSAFDDEQVLQSFQVFVRGQKDVEKSLRLTELAADVARGRYIALDQATQLVNKAAMGQVGALRRAGIQIDKNATSAQALDALLKAYSGSAATYADSAAGSTDKLSVAWENLAEQAGGPLSDSLATVADGLTVIVKRMQQIKSLGGTGGGLTKFITTSLPGQLHMFGNNWRRLMRDLNIGQGGAASAPPGLGGPVGTAGTAGFPGLTGPISGDLAAAAGAEALGALSKVSSFIDKWAAVGRKAADAQKAAAAHRARMQQQRQRFAAGLENQWGWLEFGLERAQATSGTGDDMRVLRKQEAWLKNRIAHAGRTLELTRKLWRTQQQIRELNQAGARAAGFHQVSAAKVAGMLGVGGDARAVSILAALGKGGTLPTGGAAFGRGGIVVHGNVHVHGVQNVRQLQDEVEKQNRGRAAVRRGAR